MNIKAFAKEISSSIVKQGQQFLNKGAVRELEEVTKNSFIAFVDDGPQSYDVQITLDDELEITSHQCDCDAQLLYCAHQTAMLLYLQDKGKKAKSSIAIKVRKKKPDDLRTFIDGIDESNLKDWLYDMAKTDKEFLHKLEAKFGHKKVVIDEATVREKSVTMMKAILGKAKYFDTSQIIKILQLWQPYHFDLIDEVMTEPTKRNHWQSINGIFKLIDEIKSKAKTKTNKIAKYEEQLSSRIALKIHDLNPSLVSPLIDLLHEEMMHNSVYWGAYFDAVSDRMMDIDGNVRRRIINNLLMTFNKHNNVSYLTMLLIKMEEKQLLGEYLHLFKSIPFENKYNALLAEKYLDNGFVKEAENICLQNIQTNTHKEFSIPFHQFLIGIYKDKNQKAYFDHIKELAHLELNHEYYEAYLAYEIDQKSIQTFTTKMKLALNNARGYARYAKFMFAIFDKEGHHSSMIDLVCISYPVEIFHPYAEVMYKADPSKLLLALMTMPTDNYVYRNWNAIDIELWTEILDKYYGKTHVSNEYKSLRRFSTIHVHIQAYLSEE